MQGRAGLRQPVRSRWGARIDDDAMATVENIVTYCRTIVALGTASAEEKVEYVEDIMKVWESYR